MEQRDEETYNPKIPSGTIELEAKKITILRTGIPAASI